MMVQKRPWFANLANSKATGVILDDFNAQQKKKCLRDTKYFVWDEPYLFKLGVDNLLRRCFMFKVTGVILRDFNAQ